MEHLTHRQTLWICTSGCDPVGIVKAWDTIEGRWKFFVGIGAGRDLDEDERMILEMGSKSYSLDHITAFGDLTPPKNDNPSGAMGATSPSTGEACGGNKED